MRKNVSIYDEVGDSRGFVELIDHMGSDQTIVDAARVSFGADSAVAVDPETSHVPWRPEKDPKLLRYLIKNQHWSPFEHCVITWCVHVPLFVRGQWHRHRTWCLAGDNRLHFDLSGGIERRGSQLYTRTVKHIYDAFHRSDWSRRRVQNMHLRCALNDEDPGHTRIVDIWSNGVKPLVEVQTDHRTFKATVKHRVLATGGVSVPGKAATRWVSLGEALELGMDLAVIRPNRSAGEVTSDWDGEPGVDERWEWIRGWEGRYQVSTYGRVRSFRNTRGNACVPFIKSTPPNAQGYPVVSLSYQGQTSVEPVHVLVLKAFGGPAAYDWVSRHLNGCRWDNRLTNLTRGSASENSEDARGHGSLGFLQVQFEKVIAHFSVGEEEVFDLEVEGPDHNFVCEGFVVHNSYNEVSRRYTEEDLQFYLPEWFRPQTSKNKQASDWGERINPEVPFYVLEDEPRLRRVSEVVKKFTAEAERVYRLLLQAGVCREQARMVLPQNMYVRYYGTVNLRNALAFIKLREDNHAQWEIYKPAEAMRGHLEHLFPEALAAWDEVQKETP